MGRQDLLSDADTLLADKNPAIVGKQPADLQLAFATKRAFRLRLGARIGYHTPFLSAAKKPRCPAHGREPGTGVPELPLLAAVAPGGGGLDDRLRIGGQ